MVQSRNEKRLFNGFWMYYCRKKDKKTGTASESSCTIKIGGG